MGSVGCIYIFIRIYMFLLLCVHAFIVILTIRKQPINLKGNKVLNIGVVGGRGYEKVGGRKEKEEII